MWLPEIIRAAPSAPIVLHWTTTAEVEPHDAASIVKDELRRCGALLVSADAGRWQAEISWQTLVYGLVRREVDEHVTLELVQSDEGYELRVTCLPAETHAAHAAGIGGVALFAIAVWLIVGWTDGLLPAVATALAGGLWADVSRAVAMQRLEQRLRELTESVGLALWPAAPAQLLPPPTRPRIWG